MTWCAYRRPAEDRREVLEAAASDHQPGYRRAAQIVGRRSSDSPACRASRSAPSSGRAPSAGCPRSPTRMSGRSDGVFIDDHGQSTHDGDRGQPFAPARPDLDAPAGGRLMDVIAAQLDEVARAQPGLVAREQGPRHPARRDRLEFCDVFRPPDDLGPVLELRDFGAGVAADDAAPPSGPAQFRMRTAVPIAMSAIFGDCAHLSRQRRSSPRASWISKSVAASSPNSSAKNVPYLR